MDSANILFILEWAILPLALIVVWVIRKLLLVENKTEVLEVVTKQQETSRKEMIDTITTSNTQILNRLTSIEVHLRNGNRGS